MFLIGYLARSRGNVRWNWLEVISAIFKFATLQHNLLEVLIKKHPAMSLTVLSVLSDAANVHVNTPPDRFSICSFQYQKRWHCVAFDQCGHVTMSHVHVSEGNQ